MKNIIIASLIFLSQILYAQEEWRVIGELVFPVAGGKAVVLNDEIYISGGYSKETQSNVDWVQRYNPRFFDNVITSHMKSPRYGHLSGSINEKLVFLGGINDTGEIDMSFEEFNVYLSDTTQIVASDSNFNRIFSTGVSHLDSYYLIGGNSYSETYSNTLSYIVEYDMANDSITYKSAKDSIAVLFPEQQMSAIIGDNIFIFGGVSNGVLQSIQKFNITTKTLDTLDISLLEPRAGGVAVKRGESNEIYIIGGFNEGSSALSSVEIFTVDGDNYSISSGKELLVARTNLMAFATSLSEIFVFGGYDVNGEVISIIEKFGEVATSQNDTNQNLFSFQLDQNYPNPFNPSTTIKYSIPLTSNVTLKIYNILGKEIETLISKKQSAGNYEIVFNSENLASGIYFYRLQTFATSGSATNIVTKKMTVLK